MDYSSNIQLEVSDNNQISALANSKSESKLFCKIQLKEKVRGASQVEQRVASHVKKRVAVKTLHLLVPEKITTIVIVIITSIGEITVIIIEIIEQIILIGKNQVLNLLLFKNHHTGINVIGIFQFQQ